MNRFIHLISLLLTRIQNTLLTTLIYWLGIGFTSLILKLIGFHFFPTHSHTSWTPLPPPTPPTKMY